MAEAMARIRPVDPDAYWASVTRDFLFLRASKHTIYQGLRIRKTPLDLWVYREMLEELRPAVVIEFGTWQGGSALWFCHQFEALGFGRVVSVDIDLPPMLPSHRRLTFVKGDSLSKQTVRDVFAQAHNETGPVLLIEDSRHTFGHVLRELNLYWPLVTPGSYFVVEDTKTRGVKRAVSRFLERNPDFFVDKTREKFRITSNFGGYLRRKP